MAIVVAALIVRPGGARLPAGVLDLPASAAVVHGSQLRFMDLQGVGCLCYWTDAADWAEWTVDLPRPGPYVVVLRYACQAGSEGTAFEVRIGGQALDGAIEHHTGTWYDYEELVVGRATVARPGKLVVSIRPKAKPGPAVMNLECIRLVPADGLAAYERIVAAEEAAAEAHQRRPVYIVPNFHPASCGWLTDFSTERNYCANSYFAHLDRVRDDPRYKFALSEANNVMAMMAFQPERIPELRQRVRQGRVELVNAFFLESTINLSGGEALVKMGVEGLRWYEDVLGVRPRAVWAIDVTGVHEQMGQIVSGLGLDAMVYVRDNPTPRTVHWLESPDGSRTLGVAPGHYADWGPAFNTDAALPDDEMRSLATDAEAKTRQTPAGLPVLVLGGAGDYSLPPARAEYPSEFLGQWERVVPQRRLRFATLSDYLDAALPAVRSGSADLPTSRSGARLTWTSFWIQNPKVKGWYRSAEHRLAAAEALATIASATTEYAYPAQSLYCAWLQMLLNMDRNTLWGAAGGMVFEHPRSWDVRDRFEWVDAACARTQQEAMHALGGRGRRLGLFNPVSWERTDPFVIELPPGTHVSGLPSQQDADGQSLVAASLPAMGTSTLRVEAGPTPEPEPLDAVEEIITKHYRAKVDPHTGALSSLKLTPHGRELLAGPVLLVAETGGDGHNTPPRAERQRLADSAHGPARVTAARGPVATIVRSEGTFIDGRPVSQTVRFYRDLPRIDFEVEVADIPDGTVVLAEFPLAGGISQVRRGIPYGFSHGAWEVANPALPGYTDGIQAAIRWSHYQLIGGGGVALLDRGLPGRELTGSTPTLFLLSAQDRYLGYRCDWLSGRGTHRASFALVAHPGTFGDTDVARMAYEYNAPPVHVPDVGPAAPRSYVRTSRNLIMEALRREGGEIELRMVECRGIAGMARVEVRLPHRGAWLTDLLGGHRQPLSGGPVYEFPVRPQQIVTIRLSTASAVPEVKPLRKWDELAPPAKLAALRRWLPGRVGHPPLGYDLPPEDMPVLPEDAASSLTPGRPATASNVYHGMAEYGAEMAVDGDAGTRWATDDAASQAWLEVDLGRPERIGRAYLSEAYDRVRAFELQMERGGEWVTFARAGSIGANLRMEFEPVTAQRVRLSIIDGPGGPTLWEFMLFGPN